MAVQRHDHDTDTTQRVDRYERERIVERPTQSAPPGTSNVNVGPTTGGPAVVANSAVWIVARVVTLFFTVIEVLLLFRFVLKLLGANAPIYLLKKPAGSTPTPGAARRDYERHWTPVHLDIVVPDLDAALQRARQAGATLEQPVQDRSWGRLANLADPFGHGLCILQFSERGYDAIAE